MEANQEIKTEGCNYETQEFNGEIYKLYKCEKYFTRSRRRLHREVWKYYKGPIPKGYHIHHIDGNTKNNSIENLQLVEGKKHMSYHSKKWCDENKEFIKENLDKIRPLSKEWHASEEGIEWHRQQAISTGFGHNTYGEATCKVCGEKFEKKKSEQKFCSNKCKSQWRRNQGYDDIQVKCEYCGKEFTKNKYSKIRFCGNECSGKFKSNKTKS